MKPTMFYSKSAGGFYNTTIHGDNIPLDAVEITAGQHAELMTAQNNGATIQPAENGYPVAVFPDPLTLEERQSAVWEKIKSERTARMSGGSKVGSKWFHTDNDSRIQHLGLKDSARDILAVGGAMSDPIEINGQQIQWKTMDGTWTPMTCQLSFDIVNADKNLDAALDAVVETHRVSMMAAEDPDGYDYSAGWPERYKV